MKSRVNKARGRAKSKPVSADWMNSAERKAGLAEIRAYSLERQLNEARMQNARNAKPPPQSTLITSLSKLVNNLDANKPMESAGEALGRRLGTYAGRLLGRITGSGDYNINLPSGGTTMEPTSVPEFIRSDNSRETRIRHREYLGDISAASVAGLFQNQSYRLNPGSSKTFPWLSNIAQQFEQWEPHGIAVVFKTLTSTYAASQSLGTIIIATDYDVDDAPYVSKVEMDNSEFAVSGNAAQNLIHPVECKSTERLTKLYFVQSDESVTPDKRRWSDLGNLQIASAGCLSSQLLGEVWITYDISFYKPQITSPSQSLLFTGWRNTGITALVTDLFSTRAGLLVFRPGNLDIYPVGANTLSINPSLIGKSFILTCVYSNSAGSTTFLTAPLQDVAASNGTLQEDLNLPYVSGMSGGYGANFATWTTLFRVIPATAAGRNTIVFTAPAAQPFGVGSYYIITEVNPKLNLDY